MQQAKKQNRKKLFFTGKINNAIPRSSKLKNRIAKTCFFRGRGNVPLCGLMIGHRKPEHFPTIKVRIHEDFFVSSAQCVKFYKIKNNFRKNS